MDSFTSTIINGGLETSPNYKVTVDAHELQQQVCAMAGFGVLITFGFFIYIVSWDRSQLVGLSISLRSIAKASYARHCTNPNVVRHAFGQSDIPYEKLTNDISRETF